MVRIEPHPNGPRLHVLGVRVHHWHWGAALIAGGGWLVWTDRSDLPRRHRRYPRPVLQFDPEIGVTTSNVTDGW